jgi:aubergine-like protein
MFSFRYNRRLYQIKGIDWSMTPKSTFNPNGKLKDGKPLAYYQYYDMKYGHKIKVLDQPMLKILERKNSTQFIYLVPEFCCQTGLSEAQRANHNLMKEISTITKPDPQKRMDESLKLIKKINETKESHKILSDWGLTLSDNPEDISAIKLEAGWRYFPLVLLLYYIYIIFLIRLHRPGKEGRGGA